MDTGSGIKFPVEHPQCEKCKFNISNGRDYHCAKFKFKPYDVLYEGKDCPKFEKETLTDNEDED